MGVLSHVGNYKAIFAARTYLSLKSFPVVALYTNSPHKGGHIHLSNIMPVLKW